MQILNISFSFLFLIIFLAVFVFLLIFFQIFFLGKFHLFIPIIFKKKTKKKEIYLTFDDGPDPIFTNQILKILNEYNVKATFFLTGENIANFPDVVQKIIDNNHKIGNHSYHHLKLIFKKYSTIKNEISETDKLLEKKFNYRTNLFRPPFIHYFLMVPIACFFLKKKIIIWNVGSYDYKAKNTAEIIDRVLNKTKIGSIITMHDGNKDRSKTVTALKSIIPSLLNKGFIFKKLK